MGDFLPVLDVGASRTVQTGSLANNNLCVVLDNSERPSAGDRITMATWRRPASSVTHALMVERISLPLILEAGGQRNRCLQEKLLHVLCWTMAA